MAGYRPTVVRPFFLLLPLGCECGKLNILVISMRPAMVIKIHQTSDIRPNYRMKYQTGRI